MPQYTNCFLVPLMRNSHHAIPKLKGDFHSISCRSGGEVGDGYLCSASLDPLSHLLPCLISWGLTCIRCISRFSCPLDSDSVWPVVTTGRISERGRLDIYSAGSFPARLLPWLAVSLTEGDISWQVTLSVKLPPPVFDNFYLLLLA